MGETLYAAEVERTEINKLKNSLRNWMHRREGVGDL
jgi:hypothetical protein